MLEEDEEEMKLNELSAKNSEAQNPRKRQGRQSYSVVM